MKAAKAATKGTKATKVTKVATKAAKAAKSATKSTNLKAAKKAAQILKASFCSDSALLKAAEDAAEKAAEEATKAAKAAKKAANKRGELMAKMNLTTPPAIPTTPTAVRGEGVGIAAHQFLDGLLPAKSHCAGWTQWTCSCCGKVSPRQCWNCNNIPHYWTAA